MGKETRALPLEPSATPAQWWSEGRRCANRCVPIRGSLIHGDPIAIGPCPHWSIFLPEEEGGLSRERAMAFGMGRTLQYKTNAFFAGRN